MDIKKMTLTILLFLFFIQLQAQNDKNGDLVRMNDYSPSIFSEVQTGDLITIPAGDEIEGDYISEMKFTRDGSEVWVLHRGTNNITVIDWESQNIIQNIQVGSMPMDIDFSDDLAVVACYSSNEVYFIDVNDYSIAGIETVSETPAKVHVSLNGNIAVIGCELSDVAEVFDLNTLSHTLTIPDFSVYLYKFSFITSNPRGSLYFTNFRITNDELYVVNGSDNTGLKFWDMANGDITATIPEAGGSGQIELSGDGQKLIAMKTGNPGIVSQIDIASQSLSKQMTLQDVSVYSSYSPPAVNQNGEKAMVATFPGNNTLLDFETETWQHIETGISSDWVGRNADASLFIAGDYYLSVIDPENGNILSSLTGISIQNGAVGVGNRIVASDPLRYESLVFYDFSDPNNLDLTGTSSTGSELEADATYSVKFTPDASKLLAVNSLSGTLSIIDVDSESLGAIIPLGSTETFHVDITSDSRYALIAKRLENRVSIIDLQTNEVVADVNSGGSKPDQVFVLPGDNYAYAINAGGADNIGVIALDGANSSLESTFSIGNTGISWTNYGIRSDLKITPDGDFALLANPFDEQVQVIDLIQHQVVNSIEVEGFPLQIAVAPDNGFGQFAAVTLKNNDELAILNGTGSNWNLFGIYPCVLNPVRVEFDLLENSFWVVSSEEGKSQQFDLDALEFTNQYTYNPAVPIALRSSINGRRYTLLRSPEPELTPHQLELIDQLDIQVYDFPALPIHHFDITTDGTYAAIPHPATDEVSLLKETAVGYKQILIPLRSQIYSLYPNPVKDALQFRLQDGAEPLENIDFQLFDIQGKLVWKAALVVGETFSINRLTYWQNGNYFYEISIRGVTLQSGKVSLY